MTDAESTPTTSPLTSAELAEAVQAASMPALVMLVYQFTGDRGWLSERYRPMRAKGLAPRTDAGLCTQAQQEVRDAAVSAIAALQLGQQPAITDVDGPHMAELISFFLGEEIDPGYGPMLGAEISRRSQDRRSASPTVPAEVPPGLQVAVIGLGLSGLAAVNMLQSMGIDGYTVFERGDDVGGVWSVNKYPGAGVDTPSHLYTFSFAFQDWARHFELRDELHDYFLSVFDRLAVRDHVQFGTEVVRLDYDDQTALWTITTKDRAGEIHQSTANIVLSTVGALNKPKLPELPGMQAFSGPQFHSTDWPDDLDLRGERVAIVGTGASAQQIGPAISSQAAHVTIYQRSPQWVAPFPQFRQQIADAQRRLMASTPLYHAWTWIEQFWQFGDTLIHNLRIDPHWPHQDRSVNERNEGHRRHFTRYIEDKLAGRPDLIAKAVPDYPAFGKRILLDNGWYDMLKRDNVDLVTRGVVAVDATGLIDSEGEHRDVDVIVWATGFQADHFLDSVDVYGQQGLRLRDVWGSDDPRAYLGVTVPQFPNFFMFGGPHSFPGSGSVMYITEVQARYVRDLLTKMFAQNITAISVREDVNAEYNAAMDELHARTVWSHRGFSTYYRNSKGRVVYIMPFTNLEYWERVQAAGLDDYERSEIGFVPAARPVGVN